MEEENEQNKVEVEGENEEENVDDKEQTHN